MPYFWLGLDLFSAQQRDGLYGLLVRFCALFIEIFFFFNFGLRYVCWVGLVRVLFTWAVIVLKQPSTHG